MLATERPKIKRPLFSSSLHSSVIEHLIRPLYIIYITVQFPTGLSWKKLTRLFVRKRFLIFSLNCLLLSSPMFFCYSPSIPFLFSCLNSRYFLLLNSFSLVLLIKIRQITQIRAIELDFA